jgi:hypothetical protein
MVVSAAWIGAGMLAVLNEAVQRHLNGETWKLHDLLFAGGGGWLVCGLLAPGVFAVSNRWPISGPRLMRRVAMHLGLWLLFWAAAGIAYQGVLAFFINPHATQGASTAGEMFQMLGIRVLTWTASTLPAGAAVYASCVAIEHSMRYFVEAREAELQMVRLSGLVTDARLAALESRLNPHFLFNSLNTIAVLVRDGDGKKATRVIEQLSEVLRHTLGRSGASEVALDDELEVVRQYLAVEQVRFSDRLRLAFDIDPHVLSAAVPSFAVQHLVENALRHGIARRTDAGRLAVTARLAGDALELVIEDDGAGITPGSARGEGHGLENTRERLRALYGERASLTVEAAAEKAPVAGHGTGQRRGTVARLRIPYREMVLEPSGGFAT